MLETIANPTDIEIAAYWYVVEVLVKLTKSTRGSSRDVYSALVRSVMCTRQTCNVHPSDGLLILSTNVSQDGTFKLAKWMYS